MLKLQELAFGYISSVDPKLIPTVCGSFRRGATSSGDIDILVGHPDHSSQDSEGKEEKGKKKKQDIVKRVVEAMKEGGFVTDTLSMGETKFMVSLRLSMVNLC